MLPGTSLTTGQWVRVADPDDPVDCTSNSGSGRFRCTSVTSPDASLNLYLNVGLPIDQEGWFKCCLPTSCSDPNANIIFVNIFSKCQFSILFCYFSFLIYAVGYAQIANITVDLPSDTTVLPQTYTLHANKIGNPNQQYSNSAKWYYEYGSTSIELCSGQVYSYSCNRILWPCLFDAWGMAIDKGNGRYDYTLSITWNERSITNKALGKLSNNGDHLYRFYLHFGDDRYPVTRNTYISVSSMYNYIIVDFVDIIISTNNCSLFSY